MKPSDKRRSLLKRENVFKPKAIPAMIAALGLAATLPGLGLAELADLSDVPLANAPETAVLPNLMYILDDSGSMMWDYMPDNILSGPGAGSGTRLNCKTLTNCTGGACTVNVAGSACADGSTPSDWGEPPYYSAQFNQIYYNPDISYDPGVDSTGTTLGSIDPADAPNDAYLDTATRRNVKTGYPEIYYCTTNSPSSAQLADSAVCRRNGVDNVASASDYFLYFSNNLAAAGAKGGYPAGSSNANAFRSRVVRNTSHPYYFKITPNEYCSDENLINCSLANADGTAPAGFPFPAPVRYCTGTVNASSLAAVSDGANSATPKCRATFGVGTYIYPRYGRFTRVDITSSTTTYAKSATAVRPDCGSGPTCTYAQELQNFANWYSYYRTRMAMMKTATGRAFRSIDDRYRVGFITINPMVSGSVDASRYLPIGEFVPAQKADFYSLLYAQDNHGSTPLRVALSRVGRHYAFQTDGINAGMDADPMTHSCQQNFALLTSDGYWNDGSGSAVAIGGGAVGHQDSTPTSGSPVYVSRPTGTLDGTGSTQTRQTPFIENEQVICTGGGTITNWSTGGNSGSQTTSCGCTGSLKRVWQRTRILSFDETLVDGSVTSSTTNVNSVSFTAITGCDAKVETTVSIVRETQEDRCTFNGQTNFDNVIQPGQAPVGPQTSCGCSATNRGKRYRVYERVREVEVTQIFVDGALTSTTITTTGFAVQFNSLGNGCTSNSPSVGASSLVTGAQTTTSTGVTVATNLTPTNPHTTSGGQQVTTTTFVGTSNTLADVAMYYYKTDLRTSGANSVNNVPTNDKDVAPHQHMVTFTLGLGLKGLMNYRADYETAATGDFARIKNEGTDCSWLPAGTTCNWPVPTSSSPATLDDMWHAAVNGRGTFYSAADPNSLADGLSGALSALKIQTAAASASATSSPNITETDNFIYSSTFRTVMWDGQITAQRLDTATGNVLPAIVWEAQALLDARTAETTDTRQIWKFDPSNSSSVNTNLRSFIWANLSGATGSTVCSTSTEIGCFNAKGLNLSQYASPLDDTQKALADDGQNLVNWLRGQTRYEGASAANEKVFRDREHVLGDAVNATPAYVRAPTFNFQDDVTPTYATFKNAQAGRQGVLYIAANDGMLHAFNGEDTPNAVAVSAASASGGTELWAYIPRIVFPNLHKLATDSWDTTHKYTVDGSPQVMDAYQVVTPATTDTPAAVEWKTILIGGLNKGGRGFYALDVTNPVAPKALWEICNDSNICSIADEDIGFSYGNAVITKLPDVPGLPAANRGRWVAIFTSGINNYGGAAGTGDGVGYLYVRDLFTGAHVYKVSTGAGDTTTPSGLSKISAFADNFNNDNTATFIYGGDLLGNVWRFDMSANPPHVLKLAELRVGGREQSITSRPELGVIENERVVFVGTGRYLGDDDTKDGATLTPALPWAYQQTVYAIKDDFAAGAAAGHGDIRAKTLPDALVGQTLTDNVTSRTVSNNAIDWSTNLGWYVDLNPGNTSPGERVNLDPQLVLGTLVVVSNVPNNNECTVGGDSFIYQFNYGSGSNIASSPGALVATKFTGQITVGLVVVRLPSGVFKGVATGATGTKTPVGVNVGGAGGSGRRVSWRELLR